ncbi:MAG: exodeoxyribonuclease VII small subunit [Acidobacteriota bacterium]|nr:exodeoxyribonuclease VII small subunit [Acidobacteriota bacterium]
MAKRKKEPTFEEQLAELESIVQRLDNEELPLEQAIEAYEAGVKLSFGLNKTLEGAQKKIEILTQTARGEYRAEPFDEEDEDE